MREPADSFHSQSVETIERAATINVWALRGEPLFRIALRMRWLDKQAETSQCRCVSRKSHKSGKCNGCGLPSPPATRTPDGTRRTA